MIVTSIDAEFLPALKALHNSIKANSPDTPLACMTYGDDALRDEVESLGIIVHHNVSVGPYLPGGEDTEVGCEPMYARLIAPQLYDECIWLDADQVVLVDLSVLFDLRFPHPVAAVRDPHDTKRSVRGLSVPQSAAIYAGLLVFHTDEWRRLDITGKCLTLMEESPGVEFRFVVQSVLNVILGGNFYKLSDKWQGFANRKSVTADNYHVLHWHGRLKKPWTHPDMPNSDVWREYA